MDPSKSLSQHKQINKQLESDIDDYAKKVGKLTLERDYLMGKLKSLDLSSRKAMISSKHKLSISNQAELLSVQRTSHYYKPIVNQSKIKLKAHIETIHDKVSCYGYKKAHKKLLDDGFSVSHNTVLKYRKELGIKAILAVKKPNLSKPNKQHAIYSYKLKGLDIARVNQVWSTDITYIETDAGRVYMAAIIDWYAKAVLSFDISNTMDTSLVMRVLNEALDKYGTPEIFNTDQGSQYTSYIHTQRLKDAGVIISMDGKGRATDNIVIERFWRSAKCERVYLNQYQSINDLRMDITDYIDFYNNHRYHQSLDYDKPMVVYNRELNNNKAA